MVPNVPHDDEVVKDYYCILINKEYFESFKTFAFECSKNMKNSYTTLNAQSTIITHWIIRSILGETYDMRAISSNYAVVRAQHYSKAITVKDLAKLVKMSVSSFNRAFKKEIKVTPIEYLIETRIEKAKALLRRKEISIRCGFGSSSHFASCFSRVLNMTPSEYRKSYIH